MQSIYKILKVPLALIRLLGLLPSRKSWHVDLSLCIWCLALFTCNTVGFIKNTVIANDSDECRIALRCFFMKGRQVYGYIIYVSAFYLFFFQRKELFFIIERIHGQQKILWRNGFRFRFQSMSSVIFFSFQFILVVLMKCLATVVIRISNYDKKIFDFELSLLYKLTVVTSTRTLFFFGITFLEQETVFLTKCIKFSNKNRIIGEDYIKKLASVTRCFAEVSSAAKSLCNLFANFNLITVTGAFFYSVHNVYNMVMVIMVYDGVDVILPMLRLGASLTLKTIELGSLCFLLNNFTKKNEIFYIQLLRLLQRLGSAKLINNDDVSIHILAERQQDFITNIFPQHLINEFFIYASVSLSELCQLQQWRSLS